MKNIIFLLLISLGVNAQVKFDQLNINAFLPGGVAVEIGKTNQYFGYAYGTSFEFDSRTSKGMDFSMYAKGMASLINNVYLTGQIGVRDFYAITYGFGIRGVIPTKELNIILEPLWRNDSKGTFVAGLQFRL